MKKIYLSTLLAFAVLAGYAQEKHFDLYMYDLKMVNPAFTGRDSAQIFNTFINYTSFESSNASTAMISYENRLSSISSGIGLLAYHYQSGPHSQIGVRLPYSYYSTVAKGVLTIGAMINYKKHAIDTDAFRTIDPDDPVLNPENNIPSIDAFDLDFGLVYQLKNTQLGLTVANLLEPEFNFGNNAIIQKQNRTLILSLTKYFQLTDGMKALPMIHYFSDFSSVGVDINTILEIKKVILLGAGYQILQSRDNNLHFSGGVNIKSTIQLIIKAYSKKYQDLNSANNVEANLSIRLKN
ncbi:hypothetical protein C900_05692 [Fulvivirga imtechensis AK7]|uniref:Type IX secretion system membrane protein PorP/SprF n=1 Tax=Fulvivirga imtechensis AK7 TaxID=1237149 RepID=L8JJ06_9BACT|nr:PorP/SprF family type IX secretion system membrane protein [Fulvivirga imtechensis]ELR68866.1 hypothetical protein C900_05692 [Fulvivirga imtechensis AK7]